MDFLPDGVYLTVPVHGDPSWTRWVRVMRGTVSIGGHFFTQEDFFKVNSRVESLQQLDLTNTLPK